MPHITILFRQPCATHAPCLSSSNHTLPYIIKHYTVASPSYMTHTSRAHTHTLEDTHSHTHTHITHTPAIHHTLFYIPKMNPWLLRNSSKRPYGVGLLVAGCDEKGPHLFETCPSGNYFEYYAMVWALDFTGKIRKCSVRWRVKYVDVKWCKDRFRYVCWEDILWRCASKPTFRESWMKVIFYWFSIDIFLLFIQRFYTINI